MRVVMVMFDSLNRHFLPNYGCDWTHAPNFRRLGRRAVTFDRSYVCSMPCMPARRDLHTGRPNFLHRSWGPLEPFDDSVFDILQRHGIYTHLVSDHYHYWEDGGATYHGRYNTWEFFRGQEGDPWIGQVAGPVWPEAAGRHANRGGMIRQDLINRRSMCNEEDQPQGRTMKAGIEFMRRNAGQQNWVLQIETFDPHEPFFSHRKYKDHFPEHYQNYRGPLFDWPPYAEVSEPRELVEHCRHEYASLLAMCDAKLGDVLDVFDELDLWKDTMLIVWTDHGFLLGEHDNWGKVWTCFYEETAHTPFFVWDPRCGKRDQRRQALVQPSIDLGPTLLEFFGIERTKDMLGRPLAQTLADDAPVREAGLFGVFHGQANVTDGRYVYMRGANHDAEQFQYTLMPTHMRRMFNPGELQGIEMYGPLSFTKGCQVMKIPVPRQPGGGLPKGRSEQSFQTLLWDVQSDPGQTKPLNDPDIERRMVAHLRRLMRECSATPEAYVRLGLDAESGF